MLAMLTTDDVKSMEMYETIFDITTVAIMLYKGGAIECEDSREMFNVIVRLAREFEGQFDEEKDYMTEVELFALQRLREELSPFVEDEPKVTNE